MIPENILRDVIGEVAGDDVVEIVLLIQGKTNVSEFKLAEKEASFFQRLMNIASLTGGAVMKSAKSTGFNTVMAVGIVILLASYAIYGEVFSMKQKNQPKKTREEVYRDLEKAGFKVKK